MVVSVPRPAVSPLRGVRSRQVGQCSLSVVRATVVAGQWSVPVIVRQSSECGFDKQN
jgi:hypothetical protein